MDENLNPDAGLADPNAPGGASGAAAGAGEGAGDGLPGEKVTIPRHEYEALQKRAEGENRVLREALDRLDRLEAGAPPTTSDHQPPTGLDPEVMRLQRVARLRNLADQGNEDAAAVVDALDLAMAARNDAETLNRITAFKLEMMDVPAGEQEAVKALMKQHRIGSPKMAHKLLKGEKLDPMTQEVERLKRENEILKGQVARGAAAGTRVMGQPASVAGAGAAKPTMTVSDYKAALRDPDPAVRRKALEDERSGAVTIIRD